MNWWGKLIGGVLGTATMGPIGAILGVVVGHLFDQGLDSIDTGDNIAGDTERTQAVFFTATFSIMGCIAKADGKVTPDEIQLANHVMEQMNLLPEQKRAARELFNEGKESDFPFDAVMEQFRLECHQNNNLIQMFLEIQIMTAMADGELHDTEEQLLLAIASQLGFSVFSLQSILGRIQAEQAFHQQRSGKGYRQQGNHQSELNLAYSVLGIEKTASKAEIKKAYRRLISQHHPDKLVSKGLPEEMMEIAKKKSQKITTAYDVIKKDRNL